MNLTFDTQPSGLTLYLDGIAHTGPFVYDTLVGFNHTIEARDRTGGVHHLQLRLLVRRRHTAAHHRRAKHRPNHHGNLQCRFRPDCVRAGECGNAADQPVPGHRDLRERAGGGGHQYPRDRMEQRDVQYHLGHKLRGTSVACRPTARGTGISQAIYYAQNIKASAAGTNTVTVTFNTSTPFVDVRPRNTAASIR